MKARLLTSIAVAALAVVPAAASAHGGRDHDVIGAVVLEGSGPASVGDRLAAFVNSSESGAGGYVILQQLLLGPAIIAIDCATSFSYSGHHAATFSGTAGAMRYSFQVFDQDGPDNASEEIRIAVSTLPLNTESCWATPNVSFRIVNIVIGSLDIM